MENNKSLRIRIAACLSAVLMLAAVSAVLIALTGCAQTVEGAQKVDEATRSVAAVDEDQASAAEEKDEDLAIIGKETGTSQNIRTENGTRKVIDNITISLSADVDFATPEFSSDTDIGPLEEVLMYFEPSSAKAADASDTASPSGTDGATDNNAPDSRASELVPSNLYNVQLTFMDGSVSVLHALSLEEIAKMRICISGDNIAYADYESAAGDKESSLESEKALIAEAAAAAQAQAEAEAAAAAEAEAAAAAAAAAPRYNYNYDSGSSGGSQSGDECVDDIILR